MKRRDYWKRRANEHMGELAILRGDVAEYEQALAAERERGDYEHACAEAAIENRDNEGRLVAELQAALAAERQALERAEGDRDEYWRDFQAIKVRAESAEAKAEQMNLQVRAQAADLEDARTDAAYDQHMRVELAAREADVERLRGERDQAIAAVSVEGRRRGEAEHGHTLLLAAMRALLRNAAQQRAEVARYREAYCETPELLDAGLGLAIVAQGIIDGRTHREDEIDQALSRWARAAGRVNRARGMFGGSA